MKPFQKMCLEKRNILLGKLEPVKYFAHMMKISEERIPIKMYKETMTGKSARRRPKLRW